MYARSRVTARGDEVQKREPQRARPGASRFVCVFEHVCVAVCGVGGFVFYWRGHRLLYVLAYLRACVLCVLCVLVSFACLRACVPGKLWCAWAAVARTAVHCGFSVGRGDGLMVLWSGCYRSRASSRATLKWEGS